MQNRIIALCLMLFAFSTYAVFGQQQDRVQRGQRGYVPPPKFDTSASISLKEPHEEAVMITAKCEETFGLDAFQKEILKGLLIRKFEDENAILLDESNSRDDRRAKLIARDKQYLNDLASILTPNQIEDYKLMDFSETREERKEKKRRKKKNKEKS